MKPLAEDGTQLEASYSVKGEGPLFDVEFASADGHGRNADYTKGVKVVLARLGALGAVLEGAWISSSTVMDAVEARGIDPSFAPTGYHLPLHLAEVDHERLRRALGHAGARINSPPGTSGSTTRKMTLQVSVPAPTSGAADLELRLAGDLPGRLELTMLTSLADIDGAMRKWADALAAASAPAAGGIMRLAAEALVLSVKPSPRRADAVDVRLGVRTSGAPWTVEINAPKAAFDSNGLTSVAQAPNGRLYLVRQGWLRANPDSDGDVRDERFRRLSGLSPVEVSGGVTPAPRTWYVVACLDEPPEMIRRETGAFVHACALARALSRHAIVSPALINTDVSEGGQETGGWYSLKASEAKPEKDVRRVQGEVWLALRDRLQAAGLDLVKRRHRAGYEIDGLVLDGAGVLVEIKTGSTASDVYEGVGQLMIYPRLLGLGEAKRVLLLPELPQFDLSKAAEDCGLEVHVFDMAQEGAQLTITFTDAFLAACGLPAVA